MLLQREGFAFDYVAVIISALHRPLTLAERAVCETMIRHATHSPADRARWLNNLARASASDACDCGTCPSVELAYQATRIPVGQSQVILSAGTDTGDALVLLFINDDKPSYLEVCPTHDARVALPGVEKLVFD